jgi:Tol biopolymer transport system component
MPVGRAAIAYGLAGLAAAGLALSVTRATSAATVRTGSFAKSKDCSPRRGAGQAVNTRSRLRVRGTDVPDHKALKPGNTVITDGLGKGLICLKRGGWKCTVWPRTNLQVVPPSSPGVLLRLAAGKVTCSAALQSDQKFRTPGDTLSVGKRAISPAIRVEGEAPPKTGGQLLSISFRQGKTVVKVQRGLSLLAQTGTEENAVVLGRRQQAEARPGREPDKPVPLKPLSAAEKAAFAQVAKSLPSETDTTRPTVDLTGPSGKWSLPGATFSFGASEPAAFSCAIDGPQDVTRKDYRLCTNPFTPPVGPGEHTIAVRATDAAGNSGYAERTWSYDGSRIAFESFRDGNPEIYTVEPDGARPQRLTDNLVSDEHPDWSPDRRRLVFDSLRDDNIDIYVMNADGSGQTPLTSNPSTDRNPSWSPDGTKIAFESYRDGNRELYVMNADGSGQTRLTTDPADDLDPAWSPDGRRIVFASDRRESLDLYVMNADGSGQTRITDGPVDFGPSWSPDGSLIAFHSLHDAQYKNIYVVRPDGTGLTRITRTERNDTNPSWAPDGKHIVFQSDRNSSAEEQLYLVDVESGEEMPVPADTARANFVPDW